MAKETKQQIKNKFNKLEKQLIALLELNQLQIESDDDGKVVKSKIKKYQSNLTQILEKFKEYEELSDALLKFEQSKLNQETGSDLSIGNSEKEQQYEEKIVIESGKIRSEKKKKEKTL